MNIQTEDLKLSQSEDGWRVPYIAFHRYKGIDDEQARRMLQRLVADHPEEIERVEYFLEQERFRLTSGQNSGRGKE